MVIDTVSRIVLAVRVYCHVTSISVYRLTATYSAGTTVVIAQAGQLVAYQHWLAQLGESFARLLLIDVLLARMPENNLARSCHLVPLGSCLIHVIAISDSN